MLEIAKAGTLIAIEDLRVQVEEGHFTDYTGYGFWCCGEYTDFHKQLTPIDILINLAPPPWATHLLWIQR